MIVMKFGGTSVGDRARLQRMARLVCGHADDHAIIVVVSAMGGTTDRLLEAGRHAEAGRWETAQSTVVALREGHLGASDDPEAQAAVERLTSELLELLHGNYLLREQTARSRALLASFGERLSIGLAAAHLRAAGRDAQAVDAREIVVTDDRFEDAVVDMDATRIRAEAALRPLTDAGTIPVVTGFLGATPDGITTTLGRGGSDYSAALLGALLRSDEVWIWTDVDGILTADPRLVREARPLGRVSYREAAEMSYFGARVLHPKTMLPCMAAAIPIRIRSTFAPGSPGTVVSDETDPEPLGVKTVTTIHDLAVLTVDGRGMAGIRGIARRIFQATEDAEVNVVMISQASSEQTVSLVVRQDDIGRLEGALREAFRLEVAAGLISGFAVQPGVAVLSVVGEGMAGVPGVSGALFSALGDNGVNVLAIAQGGSELSISVAILERDAVRGVRAVHTAFGLTRIVHLVVVGCGRVGRTFLDLLAGTRLAQRGQAVDLRLVALANRSRLLVDEHGLDPATAADALRHAEPRPDDATLVSRLVGQRFTDVLVVDLTASDLAALHQQVMEAGFHVVTANKLPLSGPLSTYRTLVETRNRGGVEYGYETTFGAGLPVLHTLEELVHTGDTLELVRGCFSGTLGFLCTRLEEGVDLAEAVEDARARGYTEPDAREDLSGRDVARKALIIARAMGIDAEPDDVDLTSLVPGLDLGLEAALEAYRGPMAERFAAARAAGDALRYVAEISPAAIRVGLQAVPASGPIGSLRGPDNILVFRTRRYADYPLVIRGPGAGAEVTAAGVLGDVLRIARG